MIESGPYLWLLFFGCVCAILWPVDTLLLPVWLSLRTRLFFINAHLRVWAFFIWVQIPSPRPRWGFVPVQDREPLQ